MGFSQEMKDFVAGAKAGVDMVNDVRKTGSGVALNDARIMDLERGDPLEGLKAADIESRIADREARRGLYAAAAERERREGLGPKEYYDEFGGAHSAGTMGDVGFKDGGPVRKRYAIGGAVSNEEEKTGYGALQSEPAEVEGFDYLTGVHLAAEAFQSMNEAPGKSALAMNEAYETSQAPTEQRGTALPMADDNPDMAAGGVTEAEKEAAAVVQAANDPSRKLSPDQQKLYGLVKMYQFFNDKGDDKRAKKSLQDLMTGFQAQYNRFGTLAMVAAKKGDLETSMKAMAAMMDSVPDGKSLENIEKTNDGGISFEYVDKTTGETITREVMAPDKFLEVISKGEFPSFSGLMAGAGQKPKTAGAVADGANGGGTGATAQPNVQDEVVAKRNQSEYFKDVEGNDKLTAPVDGADSPFDKVTADRVRSATADIATQNPQISHAEAENFALELVKPSMVGSAEPVFKVQSRLSDRQGGPVSIDVRGQTFKISQERFSQLERIRKAQEKQARANADEKAANDAWWAEKKQNLVGAIGDFADAAYPVASEYIDRGAANVKNVYEGDDTVSLGAADFWEQIKNSRKQ